MSEAQAASAAHLQGLNPEQLRAVTFPAARPLLVVAGPGTGKTRVLAARYVHLLLGPPAAEPDAVLAVTFTNRAAAEMRFRIARLLEAGGRAEPARALLGAWIGTFHWLSAALLRQYPVAAGVDPEFTVLDRASSRLAFGRVAARALADPGSYPLAPLLRGDFVDEAYRLVMRLKDALVGPEGFLEPALAGAAAQPGADGAGGLERDTARVVHLLYRAYEAELERRGALDFPGLIGRACAMLSGGAGGRIRRRFRYILVDEFQDTNLAQFRLLQLLAADGRLSNVTAVGDPRQAIYAWRNARVENLFDFRAREWGGDVVELVRNYRSRPQVLEAAEGFSASRAAGSGPAASAPAGSGGAAPMPAAPTGRVVAACPPLMATRAPAPADPGRPAPLTLAALPDEAAEAEVVAAEVQRLIAAGAAPGRVAVLMRGTAPAAWIEEALGRRGLPCRTLGGAAGRELEGLQDLLALLRLAQDPRDGPALCRLLARLFGVPDGELTGFCRAAGPQGRPRAPGPALLEPGVEAALSLWPWARPARDLLLDAGAASRGLSLPGLVEWASRRLAGSDEGRAAGGLDPHQLQQVVALARGFEAANPGAGLGDFLTYVGYFLQESQLEPEPPPPEEPAAGAGAAGGSLAGGPFPAGGVPAGAGPGGAGAAGPSPPGPVLIMTIHQAKGLEFDHVVVAGVRPGRFPLRHRAALLDFWPLPPQAPLPPGAAAAYAPSPGLGPGLIVRSDADGAHTPRYEAHRARLEREEAAEERRLFYVALTRARESLLVTRPQPLPEQPGRGDDFLAELAAAFPQAVAAPRVEAGLAVAAAETGGLAEPVTVETGGAIKAGAVEAEAAEGRGGRPLLTTLEAADASSPPAVPRPSGPPPLGPLSFSQIAAYRRCPLFCWLRYLARLPVPVGSPEAAPARAPAAWPPPGPATSPPQAPPSSRGGGLLLGSLVHAAARCLLDRGLWPGRGAPPPAAELERLLAGLAGAAGGSAAGPAPDLTGARRLLESMWAGPLAHLEPWPGGVELEVAWVWPGRGVRMVAVIDCLARTPQGRPLLLDFKVTGRLGPAVMAEYGHQLRFYRMGLGCLEPGLATAGLAVYHLPSGRLVPVGGWEAEDGVTRGVVEAVLEGMSAGRFGPSPACRAGAEVACDYRRACPFAAGTPGPQDDLPEAGWEGEV